MSGTEVLLTSANDRRSNLWKDWARNQRNTWLIAVLFALAPGILLGSPLLPMLVLVFGVFVRALIVGVYWVFSKKPLQVTARSLLILLMVSVGVMTYTFQIDELIPNNAMPLVDAVEKFRSENGQYPESLEKVVPKYLMTMPNLKPTFLQPSTRYTLSDGKPTLQIGSVAGDAFAHYEYDFETKVWKHYS